MKLAAAAMVKLILAAWVKFQVDAVVSLVLSHLLNLSVHLCLTLWELNHSAVKINQSPCANPLAVSLGHYGLMIKHPSAHPSLGTVFGWTAAPELIKQKHIRLKP